MALQLEHIEVDGEGHDDGDEAAGQHADPGRDVEVFQHHGGGIGADAEIGGVTEGGLPGKAGDQVPGLAHHGVNEDVDDDVMHVGGMDGQGYADEQGQHDQGHLIVFEYYHPNNPLGLICMTTR